MLPPRIGRTLGLRPISFSIPAEKIVDAPPAKEKDFPRHIVDRELAPRVGGQILRLQRRSGISSGPAAFALRDHNQARRLDALRHYEIAANGAVPCFRQLDRKPSTCAPFGLDSTNCLTYQDADDLLAQVGTLDDAELCGTAGWSASWARANTTVARATELLDACAITPVAGEQLR